MVSRQRRTDVRRQSAILAEVRRPRDPAAGRGRLLYLEASARGIIDGHVPRVACRRSAPLRLPRLCRPSCRSDAPSAPGELDSPDSRLVPAQATVCGVQQLLEASRAPRQSRPARRPRPLQRIVSRPHVVVLQSAADALRLHVRLRRRVQGALEPERIGQHSRVRGRAVRRTARVRHLFRMRQPRAGADAAEPGLREAGRLPARNHALGRAVLEPVPRRRSASPSWRSSCSSAWARCR